MIMLNRLYGLNSLQTKNKNYFLEEKNYEKVLLSGMRL